MTKKYYAIVRTSYLKYKKRYMFLTINAQLPIFWNKKTAREKLYSLQGGGQGNPDYEIIEIEL